MDHAPSPPVPPRQETPEEAAAFTAAKYRYAKAENLLRNEDFRWFVDNCLVPEMTAATETALDTGKSRDERDIAAHVREVLARITGWAEDQRSTARQQISQS